MTYQSITEASVPLFHPPRNRSGRRIKLGILGKLDLVNHSTDDPRPYHIVEATILRELGVRPTDSVATRYLRYMI